MKIKIWTSGGIVGSATEDVYDVATFLPGVNSEWLAESSVEDVENLLHKEGQDDLFEAAINQARFEWGYAVIPGEAMKPGGTEL